MSPSSPQRIDAGIFVGAAIMLGAAIIGLMAVHMGGPSPDPWLGMDYGTFRAGADALVHGQDPWSGPVLDALVAGYGLPRNAGDTPGCLPAWLLLHVALLPLSPRSAALAWAALSWTAHVVGVALLLRTLGGSVSRGRRAGLAAFGLLFPPALGTVFMGQGSGFVGLALALLLAARRPVVEALALALATLAKVFPGGLFLWVVATRRWRSGGLFLLLLIAAQVPVLAIRPTVLADFARGAWRISADGVPPNAAILANQSLRGFLLRLQAGGGPDLAAGWPLVAGLVLTALASGALRGRARGVDDRALCCGIACGISALAPYFWHHAFSALTPVFLLAMSRRPALGTSAAVVCCAPFVFDHVALPPGPATVLFGSLGFWALLLFSAGWLAGVFADPPSDHAYAR